MAVVFRAATSANIAATASPTINAPAGLTVGDVVVVCFGTNDAITIGGAPTLNGFTDLGVVPNGTNGAGHVLWKVATDTPASWTFTNLWSAATIAAGASACWHDDAAGDAGLDQSATNAPASSTTPVSASITPSVDNCMIVCCFGGDITGGVTVTAGGGATERAEQENSGGGAAYIEELLQAGAAAVTMTATYSSASLVSCFNLSIKPVAAGGGIAIPVLMRQYRARRS